MAENYEIVERKETDYTWKGFKISDICVNGFGAYRDTTIPFADNAMKEMIDTLIAKDAEIAKLNQVIRDLTVTQSHYEDWLGKDNG